MSVLGRKEIERRLEGGEPGKDPIFQVGTWTVDSFRGAGYDLRIAPDYLITPDGTRYWDRGREGCKARHAPFTLDPGSVAFVSSVEILEMPSDLAGNIATLFRRATQGILIMGGLLVDPGYKGRLHFQLANIGDRPFEVWPGKTSVAAVQFLPVLGKPSIVPSGSTELLDRLFYDKAEDPLPPLAFISNVDSLEGGVSKLERRVEDQGIKLDSTKRSTDQLVVFGVFLMTITVFTVAVAALIDAIAGGAIDNASSVAGGTDLTLAGLMVGAGLLLIVGIVCWTMMRPVLRISAAVTSRVGDAERRE